MQTTDAALQAMIDARAVLDAAIVVTESIDAAIGRVERMSGWALEGANTATDARARSGMHRILHEIEALHADLKRVEHTLLAARMADRIGRQSVCQRHNAINSRSHSSASAESVNETTVSMPMR